jgi:ABC-type transport system substrate-binding protein
MVLKLLGSPALRATVIVLVMLGAGFVFLAQTAAAQGERTELVVGLQNDMTTIDPFNPETNTVWNAYQVEWGFEGLFGSDPDGKIFPLLADPARGNGTGFDFIGSPTAGRPVVDVYIRPGVTFHDNQPMTADDVVFTYQILAWSTAQTAITAALWWDAPVWSHWTGVGKSHIGIELAPTNKPNTVRFHLSKPYALFFLGTLAVSIVPKHIWISHIDTSQHPLNVTSLQRITDSADYSGDFAFGNRPTETASAMGTGMFKFDYWTPNTGSHVSAFDGYWGKGKGITWQSVQYPFFPEKLRSIKFVIFTSLDVISLALQKGEVDTLIWSLTPGFLTQVRFNPSISVQQVTDAGYFYLAFNLRRKPWNNLALRTAISEAIDKDYIVNTLMGGFGTKGAQPISVHTPQYINDSAQPPTFNLNKAKADLDAAGIKDINGDGFREFTDGSPIKATILTPPKDYDPIRADAGIMISNNLKSIGLNIDSAPTSFDTIVAKAFTQVDFDIYILGWLLTGTPESYLTDFFHSKNDVAINPAGSNSAGYRNPTVDALLDKMEITLDDIARIKIVKDIEGIVTADIPWNVLYYRKNLNAYRNDAWVGWVNTPPQLYNFWSLVKIHPPGAFTVPPTTGIFSVAITAVERALYRQQVTLDVFVSQNFAPVSGASVWVNATFGGGGFPVFTGPTDASGHARFVWSVPLLQGSIVLKADAAKGPAKASESKLMEIAVGPPAPVAQLNLSTNKPVIGVAQTSTVVATLVDGLGKPMSGYKVSIDRTLLLGNITPASSGSDVTDAAGKATFTYRSLQNASLFPNQHLIDFIKARVNVTDRVSTDTQKASLAMFVENDNVPDWRIVTVQPGSQLVLASDVVGTTAIVQVKVTNYRNKPLVGKTIDAVLPSDGWKNLSVTSSGASGSTGLVNFTFAATAGARAGLNHTSIPVRFQVRNDASAVSDQIALALFTAATATTTYSMRMTISNRTLDPLNATQVATTAAVSINVTNALGAGVPGVPVIFQINYGPLGLPAQFPFGYEYHYTPELVPPKYLGEGLDLNSFGVGSLGGSFANSVNGSFRVGTASSLAADGKVTIPPGTPWGVENFVEDFEVVNNVGVVDACDATGNATGQYGLLLAFNHVFGPGTVPVTNPWPSDFKALSDPKTHAGRYFINVTSTTNAFGSMTKTLTALPHRLDNLLQIKAYVGEVPGKRFRVIADACNGAATITNYTWAIDSGMVISRAPVFALGETWWSQPIFSSESEVATVHGRFFTRAGPLADPEVFLLRGFGRDGRNVGSLSTRARSGAVFGTINKASYPGQYVNNEVIWNVRDQYYQRRVFDKTVWPWTFHNEVNPPLGASQTSFFSFVPADSRFAFGGGEQLFSGCVVSCRGGANLGDFWFAPTFAVLIAKVPFEFSRGYYFKPGGSFAFVTVDKTLVPVAGTATATVTVTDSSGNAIVNATVWSGPFQTLTNKTGQATFLFGVGAALGAFESLVVTATPSGQFARAWYGIMVAQPVLSYATPAVTKDYAGKPSTITVTVTNTLAVAGNATVLLLVGGQAVAAQVISIGALASQPVTFSYVFASAGDYQVTVGDKTTAVTIQAQPPVPLGFLESYGWIVGLVAGLVVGAIVGWVLLSRRGKKPPAMEASKEEDTKPSEEELGPDNL